MCLPTFSLLHFHYIKLFSGILLTLPRQKDTAGKSPESIVQELAADILSKLPPDFDLKEVSSTKCYPFVAYLYLIVASSRIQNLYDILSGTCQLYIFASV